MLLETPLSECPEAPCSRRSRRYCVPLMLLEISLWVPGGTVLAVERAILRTAYVVRDLSVGVPGGTVLAVEARIE